MGVDKTAEAVTCVPFTHLDGFSKIRAAGQSDAEGAVFVVDRGDVLGNRLQSRLIVIDAARYLTVREDQRRPDKQGGAGQGNDDEQTG